MADDDDRARRARTPRLDEDELQRGDYREILALIKGLDGRVTEIRDDAREAKEGVIRLTAATEAQDLPAKIAELKGALEGGLSGARSDLVNSISKVTGEMRQGHDDHEARLKKLEDFRSRFDGATGIVGWLAKHAPWLIAIAMTAAAAAGFKDKLP